MKKINCRKKLAAALALMICASFASCGAQANDEAQPTNQTEKTSQTTKSTNNEKPEESQTQPIRKASTRLMSWSSRIFISITMAVSARWSGSPTARLKRPSKRY